MDEYMVPSRAALIEPELKFLLLLDNAPAHLQGWLVTTTRQCCTAQSSFHLRVPQICPSLGFFVERAEDTACSVSNSCHPAELRALLTRVWQPLDVREQATVLRCRQGGFF